MTQITLASAPYLTKKKTTKREQFLREMNEAFPWEDLLRIVQRRYRKADDNGRPKSRCMTLRRCGCLRGLSLGKEDIPDETTILNFRRFLEEYQLPQKFFARINKLLEEKGLLVKSGTIVDATIIHSPSPTSSGSGTNSLLLSPTVSISSRLQRFTALPLKIRS